MIAQVLDPAALQTLVDQLGDEIDGLVARFGKRLRETPPAIAESLAQGDLETLTRHAHSLKSVAGTFGALNVAVSSERLEAHASDVGAAGIEPLVEELGRECERAQVAVDEWSAGRAERGGAG